MKQILFFLHGVGTHGSGWHKEALKAFEDTRTALGRPNDFDERYKVIGLRYDNIFEDYWKQHSSRAEALGQVTLPGNANGLVRAVLEFAQSEPDDENKWIASWGDTVLYLTTSLGRMVREKIWRQIIKALEKEFQEQGQLPRFSVIAHSLGTRVIHDVLQSAYTSDAGNARQFFGKARVLAQVANVVRSTSFDEGHLNLPGMVVHPSYDEDKGVCWRYLNLWHPLDPVAILRRFNPTRYQPFLGQQGLFDLDCKPGDVIEADEVHALPRYLQIPEFTAAIINGLENVTTAHPGPITPEVVAAARADYEVLTLTGAWEQKFAAIEELELTSPNSWMNIWEIIES